MYCHCSEHLQVSENTKTESSFVKLTEIKKKKSEHPRSEQTKNLRRLSELASIDLAPSPPSSPACHPGPAAEMTGPFIYGTEANDARGEAGEGSQPFHMAYQPSRSFHPGPSARREKSNKVRLVSLKAF